jgi:hypothetical protein
MNTRIIVLVVLLGGVFLATGYDLQLRHRIDAASAEQTAVATRLAAATHNNDSLEQEIVALRAKAAALRRPARTSNPSTATARKSSDQKSDSAPPADTSATRISITAIADTPDLRQMRVRSYIGERRLMFAGVLHQLGLTAEQLQRFDAIQAEYQQGLLDVTSSAREQKLTSPSGLGALRKQLAENRDAQLRDLFGASSDAWDEASRTQIARVVVGQLLGQSYPAAGPVDGSQTEKLIAIVARHPLPGSSNGYDWNAVAADAASVLSGSQLDALKTALSFRQLTDQLQTIAAKKR